MGKQILVVEIEHANTIVDQVINTKKSRPTESALQ